MPQAKDLFVVWVHTFSQQCMPAPIMLVNWVLQAQPVSHQAPHLQIG